MDLRRIQYNAMVAKWTYFAMVALRGCLNEDASKEDWDRAAHAVYYMQRYRQEREWENAD